MLFLGKIANKNTNLAEESEVENDITIKTNKPEEKIEDKVKIN